jgi:lipopolysaccharide export system protein LptA
MMRLFGTMLALALLAGQPAGAQQRPPQAGQPASVQPRAPQAGQTQPQPVKPAAAPAPEQGTSSRPSALGNLGSNNKEPIKIDADRLDVFDKEQRAVFKGNVVAVQGESTIQCAELTVLYEQQQRGQARTAPAPASGQGEGAIRRIDCKGPVTIVSRTQTATGDNAVFDRAANRILLTGNVALSDGPNVTTGERIVYDLTAGVANIETNPGGRVRALFVPGSNPEAGQGGGSSAPQKPQGRPPQTN